MNPKAVDAFTREFYKADLQMSMSWRGYPIVKNPCDLWAMVEILAECQPDLIVETGTYMGGSALFYAEVGELLCEDNCDVISIDLNFDEAHDYPRHPLLEFFFGVSSTDEDMFDEVKLNTVGYERVMVILDSDHSEGHVSRELELYAPLVSVGQYLVVEDTNRLAYETLPAVRPYLGQSAGEALKKWRRTEAAAGFEVDRAKERFGLTFHPGGYLKRVR